MAGATYRLQDKYDYILPEQPPDEEILYYGLPKEEQCWQREELDFATINKKWTDAQKKSLFSREFNRRSNGIWFFNNGVATYITGSHYFFLQYYKLPRYPYGMSHTSFRRYQKEFFYFLDLVDKDRFCEGGAISKPRRVGATAMINADVMNLSMLRPDTIFSIQNKKLEEAQRFNYMPIKYNIEHFPSIKSSKGQEMFMPKIGHLLNRRMKWGISISEYESKDDELNTQIYVVPTVQNADDGGQAHRCIRDEVSKYDPKINISTMLSILRPVVQTGTNQVGKILFFCTSDVEDSPNFEEWKKIYKGSDYSLRVRRRTSTGLYNYFISAKYSIEGDSLDDNDNIIELFDKYGECNEELALEWINDKKKDAKLNGDLNKMQQICRNFPVNESDAFDTLSTSVIYDNFRLNIQLFEIEKKEHKVKSALENPFYTDGYLEWVSPDKEVKFTPLESGHWRIYEMPHEKWKNKNYSDNYKYLNPADTSPYLWTCDPIDYREHLEGGSKAAIIVGSSMDSSLPNMGDSLCARYLFRPQNPNDVIENVRMAAIFWAAKGTPETNKAWLAMDLIAGRDDNVNHRPNYGRFILTWDKDLKIFRQWRYGEKQIAGMFSGNQSIEAYIRDTSIYLKEARDANEIDRISTLWDKDLINQLINFDRVNTTKSDLAVAFSIWCLILKNYKQKPVQQNGKLSDSEILKAWFGIKEKKNDFAKTRVIQ